MADLELISEALASLKTVAAAQAHRLKKQDLILKGLRALPIDGEPDALADRVFGLLRSALAFDLALLLKPDNDDFICISATDQALVGARWTSVPFLSRVASGRGAVFADNSRSPIDQCDGAPPLLAGAAIYSPMMTPDGGGLLVVCANERGVYSHEDLSLVSGLGWLISHALEVQRRAQLANDISDIGTRMSKLDGLVESEANYRLLAESATDVITRCRVGGIIDYVSSSAERVSGYTRDELIGRNMLEMVHPDDVDGVSRSVAWLIKEGGAGARVQYEYRFIRKDGVAIWLEANPSLMVDPDTNKPVAFLDIVRDITNRKLLEEQLRTKREEAAAAETARLTAEARAREAQAELERVARLQFVGEFASSIAHELNQPIAAILTNSEAAMRWMARTPPDQDEAHAAIGRTIRDAHRAESVITRTRAMLSRAPTNFADLDLNDCIEEVLLMVESDRRRRKVELHKQLADTMPLIHGDRIQIQQVMLNLIHNGLDAMADPGDRPPRLTVTSGMSDADTLVVSVADNGCGLAPQALERMFESFFTTKTGGIGLGLSISRSIITAHDGRLWARAGDDGGAVFQFTIPAAAASRP